MAHRVSVFVNSCVKPPVDPISKMPIAAYERNENLGKITAQNSVDSVSTTSTVSTADVDAEKLKDFYRSIPDYNEIKYLPAEQFYSTLKSLREKKNIMLGVAVEHIDDCNHHKITIESSISKIDDTKRPYAATGKDTKAKLNRTLRKRYSAEKKDIETDKNKKGQEKSRDHSSATVTGMASARPTRKSASDDKTSKYLDDNNLKVTPETNLVKESIIRNDRPKRHPSACSISWNDMAESKTEVDKKFDQYFIGRRYTSPSRVDIGDEFRTQSMPSSPLRTKARSPVRRRKSITIPKPFKMTERDEEERMVHELRTLQKSFSDDMLHQKQERFRSRPVPIESRIPLYEKILQDQAMRRAITKINSEAELRAQMKPFSFTKREENGLTGSGGLCERALQVLPKTKKKKRFKARPFPKNLFSNYFYEKLREDEFFRNMNRRIRAEEMLKSANPPSSMATRDRSRLSTPGAHSDLPIDPSPAAGSYTSSDRRCCSPTKGKKGKTNKEDLITTSPQPFKFSTADRAAKKMQDITRRIYQENRGFESKLATPNGGPRAYSALELRAAASGRSNLAAVLRAEAVRRRFEMEQARRIEEQRRRAELKARDKLLRSKPSWSLVKNDAEEDIAMRLQTRRDEERMRREEFLHEMELMYGRVQQQPMLFERHYAPRSCSAPLDSIQLSPRKTKKKGSKKSFSSSPSRSRKVSINDTPEAFNGDMAEYLNRIDISDSEAIDSDVGKM